MKVECIEDIKINGRVPWITLYEEKFETKYDKYRVWLRENIQFDSSPSIESVVRGWRLGQIWREEGYPRGGVTNWRVIEEHQWRPHGNGG